MADPDRMRVSLRTSGRVPTSGIDPHDAVGLAGLVRNGDVTPAELVDAAIERIERLNPRLNAVVHTSFERAREEAAGPLPHGPFRGVPFLLKDLLAADAGQPLTSGSRFTRDYVPSQDSELVRRYKASGLIIVGRTNTPELGLLPYSEPELFGPARNPWDLSRTPGGSSGGSGAAVAARIVPAASGGDGGGSIRIPAACCGVFGLKPTRGRTPNGPDLREYWHGCTTQHVLTVSVRDSAALLDATLGAEVGARSIPAPPERPYADEVGRDPGELRIAYSAHPFMGRHVHEDCVSALEETVGLLTRLGHRLVEAKPDFEGLDLAKAFLTIICAETRSDILEAQRSVGKKASARDFEAATWALNLLGSRLSAAELNDALRVMDRAANIADVFFSEHDVLLTPTLASPPVPIGSLALAGFEAKLLAVLAGLNAGRVISALGALERTADETFDFVPFTPPFNMTGQPAMSVPLVWTESGLPVGMHFVGRFGAEATLFRLAGQLERARPWAERRPPIADERGRA